VVAQVLADSLLRPPSFAIVVMALKLAVALLCDGLRGGDLQLLQFSGAHPRRLLASIKPANRRLLWPKGGRSEL
jgi:hypothetical protein